jgi:hypothetical protein
MLTGSKGRSMKRDMVTCLPRNQPRQRKLEILRPSRLHIPSRLLYRGCGMTVAIR